MFQMCIICIAYNQGLQHLPTIFDQASSRGAQCRARFVISERVKMS